MTSHKTRSIYAEYLSHWRKQNNVSQEALAERMGIRQSAISEFENGTNWRETTIRKFAAACGLTELEFVNAAHAHHRQPKVG